MPLFGDGTSITHSVGSRVVWSTSRPPLKLLSAPIISPITVSYPDVAKGNAYGYNRRTSTIVLEACTSWVTMIPSSWDSGLSLVATVPGGANYFEARMSLARTSNPSNYMGEPVPKVFPEGGWVTLNGRGAVIERIGNMVRTFRFERVGNGIYLRRKQSVFNNNGNPTAPWASGNDPHTPGFTWGGSPIGWICHTIEEKILASSSNNRRRGDSGACSLSDPTNYASSWSGVIEITPGYMS